jgi:hypothetical protein
LDHDSGCEIDNLGRTLPAALVETFLLHNFKDVELQRKSFKNLHQFLALYAQEVKFTIYGPLHLPQKHFIANKKNIGKVDIKKSNIFMSDRRQMMDMDQ